MRKNKPYAIEVASREEVDRVLNRRIRSTVELAYNHSSFWKRKFDQLGMKPEDIQTQESLLGANRKGLRVTREEFFHDFSSLVTDLVSDRYVEEIWTSGSTGLPKRVWFSKDDFKRSYEQVSLLYNAMGLSTGNYVLNLFSPDPNASGTMSKEAAKDFGLHMLHIGVGLPPDKLLKIIKFQKPQSVFALGTKAYQLPRQIEELGEKASDLGIESILLGGEPCTIKRRNVIERDWKASIIDCLASAELSVFGYQTLGCNKDVMHIPENRLFVNFVDPKTLDPVDNEEKGVDLVSTLYDLDEKPAMILLGCSLGDSSRLLDSKKCNCGRTYKQIEWPVCRNDYTVHMAGQNVYPVLGVESAIADSPFLTGEYVTMYKEASGPQRRPYLEVRIEAKGNVPENEKKQIEEKIWSYVISNPAAYNIVASQSDLLLKIMERGHLFEGLETYQRPGKPIRLIKA
jgi:phenylacetate-CoA ligase